MKTNPEAFEVAVARFKPADVADAVRQAAEERAELLRRFPLDHWPAMTLEEYAAGHDASRDSYCRWLEFNSVDVGSIRGGSARKLIVYKHKEREGWYFPRDYSNEQEAWQHVRRAFIQAFEYAHNEEWERIDELEALDPGPALKLKTLHLYFQDRILPVFSTEHLRYFLRALKRPDAEVNEDSVVSLNRSLLAALQSQPSFAPLSTKELERFLYSWADPREARRVFKIAPGGDAHCWDACHAGGYICVGWDEVGDLRAFNTKDDFNEAFARAFPGHKPTIVKKAKELWTLIELEPGDLVVANHGIGRILAVGEVTERGYEFSEERPDHKHTVSVKWDTSYAKAIPPQKRWAFLTVAKVPDALVETILARGADKKREADVPPTPLDPLYPRIATSLQRKGQVILYGPPGTGKTYTARRFAVWWLLRRAGRADADAVLIDSTAFTTAERELSTGQVNRRVWWIVANAKEWSWEKLFHDGRVEYRHGRLQRNYPLVQRGDLVVGYQSTPEKQILALGRITRDFQSIDGSPPSLEIEPLRRIVAGPTYEDLLTDPILSKSEPMRFRNQGTLFALTPEEAEHLATMLSDRNPDVATLLSEEPATESSIGSLAPVTFHPSYSYEDFIEGFRPVDTQGNGLSLRLEDGIFKRVCRVAQANPKRAYLLLVDEINRANVAKVLGELLTLLEPDKRGLTVSLPQSKERFSIPPNVYILGTMNTADRSIKLLDAALRRRFAFIELMPDIELLRGATVGGLALDDFLEGLNRRIAASEGREKQIGHSYLLESGQPIGDAEEFARRFREEILPLLQEYCYDEYGQLAKFIGETLVDANAHVLDQACLADSEKLIAALADEFCGEDEATA